MSVEMSQAGKITRPQFFILLCPVSLQKLTIPHDFMKYIEKNRTLRKAILLSPLVKFWHVVVERHDKSSTMSFGRGWSKFVEAHNLQEGNMVTFRYEGNMLFAVKIFFENGCRRYTNTASVPKRALYEQTSASSSSCVPSDDSANSEESMTGTNTRKRTLETEAQDELPNTREYSQASESILKWEVVVTSRLLSSGRINIPKRLMCLDQFSREKGEVIVTDRRGRKWPIRLTHRTESGLGRGWRLLAQENNVEEGDVCIFEFVSDKLIRVQVEKKR
ncbi:putative B3 domain-containing protein Os04g0346900 [Zingiber officinale]|uniref:putative B3 domain-containing protein Os04g0346900 n=1 Tax=Zingiber officinale TaxID=94328 RepID=UPI001C4D3E76|nr:putative B3 domain-containing protein Os04g0346900 [Zingiber officinale]